MYINFYLHTICFIFMYVLWVYVYVCTSVLFILYALRSLKIYTILYFLFIIHIYIHTFVYKHLFTFFVYIFYVKKKWPKRTFCLRCLKKVHFKYLKVFYQGILIRFTIIHTKQIIDKKVTILFQTKNLFYNKTILGENKVR